MRNILAIAQKELRSYFSSPIAYIIIGFFALPFGVFFYLYLGAFVRQSLQMAQYGGSMNINQQVIRIRPAECVGDHPVRDADDHDANLLGGKTVGHDRAPADVANHRHADHRRQVPGRARPLRRDAPRHGRLHRHPLRLRQP